MELRKTSELVKIEPKSRLRRGGGADGGSVEANEAHGKDEKCVCGVAVCGRIVAGVEACQQGKAR